MIQAEVQRSRLAASILVGLAFVLVLSTSAVSSMPYELDCM